MSFSKRIGLEQSVYKQQKDNINEETRNSLWNVIHLIYFTRGALEWRTIAELAYNNFWKLPLDEAPEYQHQFSDMCKRQILREPWNKVYDFIEWLANHGDHWNSWRPGNSSYDLAVQFQKRVNQILTRENSAYRFVDSKIVEITDEVEIESVNQAARNDGKYKLSAAHIQNATKLLASRESPDFRNSIKEAISAVESACKIIAGGSNATLGSTLSKLEKSNDLHPALKEGFSKLYGWTSDSNGIRHAMLELPSVNRVDAKFMLVTCSAFVNYLIEKYET